MDVKKAANITVGLYDQRRRKVSNLRYSSYSHILDMNEEIQKEVVTGEKAHRWLGWIQACAYQAGLATLDELKQINKES